jgi:hypothetical protein
LRQRLDAMDTTDFDVETYYAQMGEMLLSPQGRLRSEIWDLRITSRRERARLGRATGELSAHLTACACGADPSQVLLEWNFRLLRARLGLEHRSAGEPNRPTDEELNLWAQGGDTHMIAAAWGLSLLSESMGLGEPPPLRVPGIDDFAWLGTLLTRFVDIPQEQFRLGAKKLFAREFHAIIDEPNFPRVTADGVRTSPLPQQSGST